VDTLDSFLTLEFHFFPFSMMLAIGLSYMSKVFFAKIEMII
jgi:hypothetical protein